MNVDGYLSRGVGLENQCEIHLFGANFKVKNNILALSFFAVSIFRNSTFFAPQENMSPGAYRQMNKSLSSVQVCTQIILTKFIGKRLIVVLIV